MRALGNTIVAFKGGEDNAFAQIPCDIPAAFFVPYNVRY